MSGVHSNADLFEKIAEEQFAEIEAARKRFRQSRPDGEGWIFALDPAQSEFKAALISIAFSAMWLDAKLHLVMVERLGKSLAKKHDTKTYEGKLVELGVSDEALLLRVKDFRALRRELMHEKAFQSNDDFRFAQDEAKKTRSLMAEISARLMES
ncbi:hypothetical protein [Ponticoccus litoralis]|uniref:DUF4145 domain-containing protein n=1 Tax=Ponticoccus litoralis TaxID=422297 RepID=A0AAW9SNY7_9RHOB